MSRQPILTDDDKRDISHSWLSLRMNQTELAQLYSVHRRTIQRALIETGTMLPYRHLSGGRPKNDGRTIGYDMGKPGGDHSVEVRGHANGTVIQVDEVIEKVLPTVLWDNHANPPIDNRSPELKALHDRQRLPPAASSPTEQLSLRIPTIHCTRWVNVYDNGPAPVMHLSREHALANRSDRKRLVKVVAVEVPL